MAGLQQGHKVGELPISIGYSSRDGAKRLRKRLRKEGSFWLRVWVPVNAGGEDMGFPVLRKHREIHAGIC